jgi:N-acyl-D-amino-acid deacylase
MNEDNVRKEMGLPCKFWLDAGSMAPEGYSCSPVPRAYGNFARVIGKYVRMKKY